jgi:phosphoribosylformylglycinamidine synthase
MQPIDLPMSVLFGKPPKLHRQAEHVPIRSIPFNTDAIEPAETIDRVLAFPAVADKSFLIHIGDRSVTGLVARDQTDWTLANTCFRRRGYSLGLSRP